MILLKDSNKASTVPDRGRKFDQFLTCLWAGLDQDIHIVRSRRRDEQVKV